MMMLWINLGALLAIAFIVWWFWLAKPSGQRVATAVAAPIDIVVEGGVYTPARIEVVAGQPLQLRFDRRDPSPCAEKVIFADLGVSADLPLGQPVTLVITPPPGEHEFTCQMGMYRGVVVVG